MVADVSRLILVLLIGGMVLMIRPEAQTGPSPGPSAGPSPDAMNRIAPAAGRLTPRAKRTRLHKRRHAARRKARLRRKRRR